VGYYPLGAKAVQQNPAIHVPGGSKTAAAPEVLPAAPNRGPGSTTPLVHSPAIMPTQNGKKNSLRVRDANHFTYISLHVLKLGSFSHNKINEFLKIMIKK
jgi:hypothetical protein